jgi:hypothetical protein
MLNFETRSMLKDGRKLAGRLRLSRLNLKRRNDNGQLKSRPRKNNGLNWRGRERKGKSDWLKLRKSKPQKRRRKLLLSKPRYVIAV